MGVFTGVADTQFALSSSNFGFLGMLMGSSFAGLMMDIADLRDAFSLGAVISFAGVLLFFALTKPGSHHLPQEDVI